MYLKKLAFALLLLAVNFAAAQLKIGSNPNRIDAASIIELESTSKAFVLTRVSDKQMQQITPLRGALVYNTDTKCVHYYNGAQWANLCSGAAAGTFSFKNNGNGTFTINYSDGSSFTSSDLTGPKGDTGATGPQGPAGADGTDGADGAQGPAGADGVDGAQGPKGDIGATGPQGPAGADGTDGVDGAQGPKGDKGDTGADGAQGPAGADGNNGADGTDGATGPQGLKGDTGADGPQGPAGADGVDGAQGPKGDTGATGPQGPAGADGTDGVDGAQGPKGDKGDTGADGAQGPAGADGNNGADGTDGADGADGAQGPIGNTGPQGPAGTDGVDGATGPQGLKGDKGDTGADGAQGPAGADGTDGVVGATGPQGPAGADGVDGATGPQGLKGDQGDTGATGPQGPAGADGVDGADGAQGAKGDKGDIGATGPQGPAGADGVDGAQGPKGDKGDTGATGSQGPAGADGATGPQGLKGDTGADGADGVDGADGTDGATGPQGPKGDTANPSWELAGNAGTNATTDFVGTSDGQDLVLKSNNVEKLRLVQNKGQVLVNQATTFNNHPLVIRANGIDVFAFEDSAGSPQWHWNLLSGGLNFVESNVADYRLFLEDGGDVGINTADPTETLDVNGNARIRSLSNANNTDDILAADASGVMQRSKINYGGRWTNTDTTTDLNVNNTTAPIFGTQDYKDDGNNLYQVTGNTLQVKTAGRYDIRANISMVGIGGSGNSEQRTNVNARIAVNGTAVGAIGASGYIRFNSGHEQSSIHVNEILQLNANDVITIITYREANNGTVQFSGAGESSFVINKLR